MSTKVAKSDFMNVDMNQLKRKFKASEDVLKSCFKSSSGNGPRLECIVLKRGPQKPKSVEAKKPPPVSISAFFISKDIELVGVASKAAKDEDYGAFSQTIKAGDVHWVSVFNLPADISEGSRIMLENTKLGKWEGRLSLSASSANVMSVGSFKDVAGLPVGAYKLPELKDIETKRTAVIPINMANLKSDVLGMTSGVENSDAYMYEVPSTNCKEMGAYVKDYRGYPFVVRSAHNQTNVLLSVKLYQNHLKCFGITDVAMWGRFARQIFDGMIGVMVVYIRIDDTKNMDMNCEDNDTEYDYALAVGCNYLFPNLPEMIKNIGFEVSFNYVSEHFGGQPFLESKKASSNPLYIERETGSVVCLSEYMGGLTKYGEEDKWALYTILDVDTSINDESLCEIRNMEDNEEREAAIAKGGDVFWENQYIYAVKK